MAYPGANPPQEVIQMPQGGGYGQPQTVYGHPVYAQQAYGQQVYGQQAYGQPAYGHPSHGGGYGPQHGAYSEPQPVHYARANDKVMSSKTTHSSSSTRDLEGGVPLDEILHELTDGKVRRQFIRKVFTILFCVLSVTFGLCLLFTMLEPAKQWLVDNMWLTYVAMALSFVFLIALTCCPKVARTTPWNYICLFGISVCFGVTFGVMGAALGTYYITVAMGITASVVIVLMFLAWCTKIDFTKWYLFAIVAALVLMLFGIVAMIVRNKTLSIVYAAIGTLLFCFYIVFDTQRIIGGKHHKYQFGLDDYVFATLALFLDIVNLFTFILQLLALTQN